MFTGIIRQLGEVVSLEKSDDGYRLSTNKPKNWTVSEGDSIAVNGACLTVLPESGDNLVFHLMQETLDKTTLGNLKPDAQVNLEQTLAAGDRFDGHFVQGHVDGVAEIVDIAETEKDKVFTFKAPASLAKYLTPKGSVALNGVSLTVIDVDEDKLRVSMFPYTLEHTTFGKNNVGDKINIECDILAKQVVSAMENLK